MARLPTAQENLAIEAIFPPTGTAGSVGACSITSASAVMTSTNSFVSAGIVPGMTISGTGVGSGAIVVAVDEVNGKTLLMSVNATTTESSESITFANADFYLSLNDPDPGTTGASEVSGGSYARQVLQFGAPSSGSEASTDAQNFTSMPSATIDYFGLWTASTSGTYLGGGQLASSLTVPSGATVAFAIGAVTAAIS